MSAGAPSILIHHDRPDLFRDLIEPACPDARLTYCRNYDGLADAVSEAQPEIVLSYKFAQRPYPRASILASSSVRWIHCGGAGIDHLVPWDTAQVTVTNSAGIAAAAIAEYALGAVYALNMRLPLYMRQQAAQDWASGEVSTGSRQTLCVIGLGHIGSAIARMARGAGLTVIGVRRGDGPSDAVEEVYPITRLTEALSRADHTVVIVPLTPETRGLLGTVEIAAMKPGSTLINVSRGGVVAEAPLIAALSEARLSGAVLDVFAAEPLPEDSPFWTLPNVIVTPHVAGSFKGWERAAAEVFRDNLRHYLAGQPLSNVADPARGY